MNTEIMSKTLGAQKTFISLIGGRRTGFAVKNTDPSLAGYQIKDCSFDRV